MEEIEYKDNEKVLYKTRVNKGPEEVDCYVTDGHVVVEAKEPIKIPVSSIRSCDTWQQLPSLSYPSTPTQESLSGTTTLLFFDELNTKRKLTLGMPNEYLDHFKYAINRQRVGRFIDKVENRPGDAALGSLFSGFREFFRDKTRDKICAGLRTIGVSAQLAVRGRLEEKIECPRGKSLGVIQIPEGPIRWLNIRKETQHGSQSSTTYYYTDYGILDSRLGPDSPGARIRTTRVKTVPLVGKVVDVRWEGNDFGLGIISRLNDDDQLKHPIMSSRDVTIKAIVDHSCWIITTETRNVPSRDLWDCYQAIGRRILA